MQKIDSFLWFDNQAEEASTFYVSAFSSAFDPDSTKKNSGIISLTRYGKAGPGTVKAVTSLASALADGVRSARRVAAE